VRLNALLHAAGIAAPSAAPDPEITAIDHDSRHCGPGSLFVAVPGFHVDGHRFAAQAVRAGAAAVVAERLPDPPLPEGTPLALLADTRVAISALGAVLHGHPSRRLTVAGITGTDGKTTTTTMLWAAWRAAGVRAGSITTVDIRTADEVVPNRGRVTTLEAPELHERLAGMAEAGCTHVALETSSHGLHLHRVDDIDYDLAAFTRITSEHLDLHGTREAYLEAKAHLLDLVGDRPRGLAVLDRDDDFAYPRLLRSAVRRRITYSAAGNPDADLCAEDLHVDDRHVSFTAATPWGRFPLRLHLAGAYNAANALAALAAAAGSDTPAEAAARGISELARVPGRMERIDTEQGFSVVVDYAHTAAALDKVLRELRPTTPGRLWAVFGSAGERDHEKRGSMGGVAGRLADIVVVTDEDPRGEDRQAILEEIAAGAEAAGAARGERLHLIADRTAAIGYAIANARPGDTVLLAGKGHEATIETDAGPVPWDERAVAEAALRARGAAG
jgi:UDP-N-acetylmuramoyl-L-alanyl-D-glutamate--2,6-diaminopimelate ligase